MPAHNDIYYLHIAIKEYETQKKLAYVLKLIYQKLHSNKINCKITQNRISAWIHRDNKVPVEMILPLQLALKRVGFVVSLNKINPSIYPKSSANSWVYNLRLSGNENKNRKHNTSAIT